MRNILAAIDLNDLVKLLEKSQDEALSCTAGVDEDATCTYMLVITMYIVCSTRQVNGGMPAPNCTS